MLTAQKMNIINQVLTGMLIVTLPVLAWASESEQISSKAVPCAILEKFEGEVQVLNASRTHLLDIELKIPIPCGSWISVHGVGWALLKHRQGFEIKMGSMTFIEIFDNYRNAHLTGEDHIVLYKGKVFVNTGKGNEELRVVTANARARMKGGQALIMFDQENEESQLVAIDHPATLENRFEPGRRIIAKRGEATNLNFKRLRIVPSTPMAVKVASLKAQLYNLPFGKKEKAAVIAAAMGRSKRKFAKKLDLKKKGKQPERAIASEDPSQKAPTYERHPPDQTDSQANAEWINRLVGGTRTGREILFPSKFQGKAKQTDVIVDDKTLSFDRVRRKEESQERQKLIDELRSIRVD